MQRSHSYFGFVRQLYDHCIFSEVAKKHLDTLGTTYRSIRGKIFEKGLHTTKEDIPAIDANKEGKTLGACIHCQATNHLYRDCQQFGKDNPFG